MSPPASVILRLVPVVVTRCAHAVETTCDAPHIAHGCLGFAGWKRPRPEPCSAASQPRNGPASQLTRNGATRHLYPCHDLARCATHRMPSEDGWVLVRWVRHDV